MHVSLSAIKSLLLNGSHCLQFGLAADTMALSVGFCFELHLHAAWAKALDYSAASSGSDRVRLLSLTLRLGTSTLDAARLSFDCRPFRVQVGATSLAAVNTILSLQ